MLVQQYIKEFNNLATNVKNLSFSDEVALSNKLKLIQSNFSDINDGTESFFTNLYHLLCQANNMQSELLESCLNILLIVVNSRRSKLKTSLLSDFRFLSVLVGNVISLEIGKDDQKLIKLLIIIRELLSYSSEMDEHSLKLMIEALKDQASNNQDLEIARLSLSILANLCLDNYAARYFITRAIEASEMQKKIKNAGCLISFKFFVLLEDEIVTSDVKYFLKMSLQDVRAGIESFNSEPIRHSLDIMKHIRKMETNFNFKFNEEEQFMSLLSNLNQDLMEALSILDDSEEKQDFFEGIFQYFCGLLNFQESELASSFEEFTETVFLSPKVSRSSSALQYLAEFFKHDGSINSSEIVLENVFSHFIESNDETNSTAEQQFSFLYLLESLTKNDLLSDVHTNMISTYFDKLLEHFKQFDFAKIEEEDLFLFIRFLSSLANVSTKVISYYRKLNEVLKLDFTPMLIAKGYLSKNAEIITILFELTKIENFPNQKVASMLAKSGTRAEGSSTQPSCKSFQHRDIQFKSAKLINKHFYHDVNCLIERINGKLDNNEIESTKISDVIHLYRLKIIGLNDQLTSVTTSLERSTTEITELKQKIASFGELTEKQEFVNWSLQLTNERLSEELAPLEKVVQTLKDSLTTFQKRIDNSERALIECKKMLQIRTKELEDMSVIKAQAEKRFQEIKAKLKIVQNENETRIKELKTSLENEKKSKGAELEECLAEQKKLNQKLAGLEKEHQKQQDLLKIHEKEIVQKQALIHQYETELKDSEHVRNTIMSLMQTKSFKK